MTRFKKRLFDKIRHYVFGAVRRRSRSERELSSDSDGSRGTLERPFMSEASLGIGMRLNLTQRSVVWHRGLICKLLHIRQWVDIGQHTYLMECKKCGILWH